MDDHSILATSKASSSTTTTSDHDKVAAVALHSLQRRADRLASHFGHKDFATLERSVGINIDAEDGNSGSQQTEDVKIIELRAELEFRSTEISSLRKQLGHLASQYDDLYAAKERAAEKYKADYRKWKAFKSWLVKGAVKREGIGGGAATPELLSSSGKGKFRQFEEGFLQEKGGDVEDVFASPVPTPLHSKIVRSFSNRARNISPTSPDRQKSHKGPSPSRAPSVHVAGKENLSAEDSPTHPHFSIRFNSPPHPRPQAVSTSRPTSSSSAEGSSSRKRKRRDADERRRVAPVKIEEEVGYLETRRNCSPVKHSPKIYSSLVKGSIPGSEPDYRRFKGKGRYRASAATVDHSLANRSAQRFDGDPYRPAGPAPAFAYEAVERNRDARKQLHAEDCFCCRDYYDTMDGVLPSKLQAPLWRSPPRGHGSHSSRAGPSTAMAARIIAPMSAPAPRRHHHDLADSDNFDPDFEQPQHTPQASTHQHRQLISRHRAHFPSPATPPDYWEIGFPTTQDVQRINERAERERIEKGRP